MQLPPVTKSGSTVVRISVPSALAAVAAMFPAVAPIIGIATPAAMALLERSLERPGRAIEDALRRGELIDLSDDQFANFVPMAYRIFLAAQQGEYERNLRLLAAFMTSELKSETCEPGSLLGMARRLEGLDVVSLRAIALIGEWKGRAERQDQTLGIGITAGLLANALEVSAPLSISEAVDAIADLAGRGFLSSSGSGFGGTEYYHSTSPLESLLAKAVALAK